MLNEAQAKRLHELKLRGLVPFEDSPVITELVESGLARQRGAFLALTPEGRAAVEAASRLADSSEEHAVAQIAYDAFIPVNAAFLEVCAAWQLKPTGDPNEHDDPAYDWEVRESLDGIHERVAAVLRRVVGQVPRFASYVTELEAALEKLDAGANEWFASPRIDSYHTVWMHLHEEFRLALGISAGAELAGESEGTARS